MGDRQPFSRDNGTWVVPEHMNTLNQEESSRYVENEKQSDKQIKEEECDYLIDQKLKETPSIQLLDVRTADEYNQGHIDHALNLDVKQPNFMQQADSLLDKKYPVAVYCRSGVRSQQAARQLVEQGFIVYNLKGGYLEWKSYQP